MSRSAAIAMSLLLFGAAMGLTSLAQDVQSNSARTIVSTLRPDYPELARAMRLEGSVKLRVTVTPNGTAKSVETIGGHPLLVQAAEQAVHKWTWVRSKDESTELVEVRFHLH